ncbi:hypothetical protein [Streptomyces sp. NPDC001815]|uniref:tetratricopeptide repeat protein n=1 Tax=Streptomyces sp. NPDC001815 TaxID=3154526 RepID=UPI0033246C2C
MNDFDRIFEPQYTATELFTNRVDEYTAFSTVLRQHSDRVRDGSATLAHTARLNVMSFYGVGGIGKTELSRRLESWAVGDLQDPGDWTDSLSLEQPLSTVRVDFHGSRVVHAADTVLRLRAAVAGRRRRFPAFDLGLAAWWSLARPGTALPDLAAGGFDVRGQITETLNDVLSDAGAGFGLGPLTVQSGIRIVDAVRENRLRSRTLRRCEPLVQIVNQAQKDPSDYVAATLAGLLSWDLENLPVGKRPIAVAFADAAEYIQGDDRAQERLFNRVVHLTPGILWVVTSRNRLDWDNPHLNQVLPATGPGTWPGLRREAEEDPRQHLVGNLSDTDVEKYLQAASGAGGNPQLSPGVIDRIRVGAHGLPLYLSLSLSVARAACGNPLTPDAFGGPLPELATRVFANLPEQERKLARAAALVPRFDEDLIAQAADGLLGDAHRLCRRTLVSEDDHPLFRYRLHDAVRSAIAHEPVADPGAWAPADRTAMARRLVETLRRRSDALLEDSNRRLDVLELAAALCAEHDLTAPWLADALTDLPGFSKTAERLPRPTSDTWMGQLSGMFEAWRQGRVGLRRIARLEEFLSTSPRADIRAHAQLRLAYLHRNRSDFDASLRLLTDLLAENPESQFLRYQVARALQVRGGFTELHRHLSDYPLDDPTTALRINSDLAYVRGLLNESIAGPATRGTYLREQGKHQLALDNEAAALWRRTFLGRSTPDECDAVLAEADRFGETLTMRTALAAKLICQADDSTAARHIIDQTQSIIRTTSGRRGWREWTSSVLFGLRQADHAHIDQLHHAWLSWDYPWSINAHVVDRFFVFAGYPARYRPVQVTSEEDPAAANRRWHGAIESLVDR